MPVPLIVWGALSATTLLGYTGIKLFEKKESVKIEEAKTEAKRQETLAEQAKQATNAAIAASGSFVDDVALVLKEAKYPLIFIAVVAGIGLTAYAVFGGGNKKK